jgi:hypothetical protein
MAEPFDPSLYVRAPIVTASTGVTLAYALHDACPKDPPANVKKASKHLKSVADKAKADLAERNRKLGVFSDEDSRELDNEADRAWGGFRLSLQGMAMLDPEKYPRARRAAEIEAKVFAQGSEFLKAEFSAQSTAMATLLKQIRDDGLQPDIDDVIGKEFLQAIKHVQPRYEAMVKERLRRDNAAGQNLADSVRAIQGAIVNYAQKILGTIEHDDPATMEAARVALLPIANFREAAARGAGASGGTPEEPQAPGAGEPKPE